MKKKLLNKALNIIKKERKDTTEEELEIIAYGLEAIYLMITKLIIIFIIAYFLNIFKQTLLFFTAYGVIRTFASGYHASTSLSCFIISSTLLLGGTYLSMIINVDLVFKIIISLICIILLYKYAPADTVKRPLVNVKKRKRWKIISTSLGIIYLILIILFNNIYFSNYLLVGLIIATLLILPITYKIFKSPYNNYLNYQPTV